MLTKRFRFLGGGLVCESFIEWWESEGKKATSGLCRSVKNWTASLFVRQMDVETRSP